MKKRRRQEEFTEMDGPQDLISQVMAEFLADFNKLDEATTPTNHLVQDFSARLLLKRDLCFQVNKEKLTLPIMSISARILSVMLSDN